MPFAEPNIDKGSQTLHFFSACPAVIGMAPGGALLPVTVAGYEWRSTDDN